MMRRSRPPTLQTEPRLKLPRHLNRQSRQTIATLLYLKRSLTTRRTLMQTIKKHKLTSLKPEQTLKTHITRRSRLQAPQTGLRHKLPKHLSKLKRRPPKHLSKPSRQTIATLLYLKRSLTTRRTLMQTIKKHKLTSLKRKKTCLA